MKQLTLAALGASLLMVIFASLSWLIVTNLDYALARYPAAMSVGGEHFNLLSAPRGYISQHGVYQTGDDVMSVWRWYDRHLGLEPDSAGGIHSGEPCVRLEKTNQYLFLQRAVGVLLCSRRHRTMVFVSQAVYLQR